LSFAKGQLQGADTATDWTPELHLFCSSHAGIPKTAARRASRVFDLDPAISFWQLATTASAPGHGHPIKVPVLGPGISTHDPTITSRN
jgi:hypothetical protein